LSHTWCFIDWSKGCASFGSLKHSRSGSWRSGDLARDQVSLFVLLQRRVHRPGTLSRCKLFFTGHLNHDDVALGQICDDRRFADVFELKSFVEDFDEFGSTWFLPSWSFVRSWNSDGFGFGVLCAESQSLFGKSYIICGTVLRVLLVAARGEWSVQKYLRGLELVVEGCLSETLAWIRGL